MSTQAQRLDFRLSAANRKLIQRAAAILGQPLTAFAVQSLVHAAEKVIDQDLQRRLTDRDRKLFLSALDHGRPNAALKKAAKRFRAEIDIE